MVYQEKIDDIAWFQKFYLPFINLIISYYWGYSLKKTGSPIMSFSTLS